MEVYVSGVPKQFTNKEFEDVLKPPLAQLSITVSHCSKILDRSFGFITFAEANEAIRFVEHFMPGSGHALPRRMRCKRSNKAADPLLVRSLEAERKRLELHEAAEVEPSVSLPAIQVLEFATGLWHYVSGDLVFDEFEGSPVRASMIAGPDNFEVVLNDYGADMPMMGFKVHYEAIDCVVSAKDKQTDVYISMVRPPTFYRIDDTSGPGPTTDTHQRNVPPSQANALSSSSFDKNRMCRLNLNDPCSTDRQSSLCLVYRLSLRHKNEVTKIRNHLEKLRGAPKLEIVAFSDVSSWKNVLQSMEDLESLLKESVKRRALPFIVAFQLQRLAQNNYLHPEMVISIVPEMKKMALSTQHEALADAISTCARTLPHRGPHAAASDFEPQTIILPIKVSASRFNMYGSLYATAGRTPHLAMIHKVYATPTGSYLVGPELETMNRVLRKYSQQLSHFVRVSLLDEDFGGLQYEPRVGRSDIYSRFRKFLDDPLEILGRGFTFLGFSNSSLGSAQCWFMAPFVDSEGHPIHASAVIEKLGDFSRFTCPARCAARIGQAFSDSTKTFKVNEECTETIEDVERNERCFTDGVGKVSKTFLDEIWRQNPDFRKSVTIALQIRYRGAKGMVTLDTGIDEEKLMLRHSMVKFNGSTDDSLEIVGAASRPLRTFLNRGLIKILEDLSVPDASFLDLQKVAVDEAQNVIKSPENAAKFIKDCGVGRAVGLSDLLRNLLNLGVDFPQDLFLRGCIQIAILTRLRQIKYKGRIPVEKAKTLFGVTDETGYLKEHEIYVAIRSSDPGSTSVIEGPVLITRSPQMHPGDVQMAQAVDVPQQSPLKGLHNVVVFSQNGERDLPSMLAGGDLDGDLFNVIYDSSLFPKRTSPPASYPRVQPVDIGRTVEIPDMTAFFIQFMENNKVGAIANQHLVRADQSGLGTFDVGCIKLANLYSRAVDYGKTGKGVNWTELPPKINHFCEPDYMKKPPRLVLEPSAEKESVSNRWTFEEVEQHGSDQQRKRYYESQKILGKLYRNIDEAKIIQEIQDAAKAADEKLKATFTSASASAGSRAPTRMHQVLEIVLRKAKNFDWRTHVLGAVDIRRTYERTILDFAYSHTSNKQAPLSELEIFTGTVLGRSNGMPSKRERDSSMSLHDRFALQVRWITDWMLKGKSGLGTNTNYELDLEGSDHEEGGVSLGLYADDTSSEVEGTEVSIDLEGTDEAFARCVACFYVSLHDDISGFGRPVPTDPILGPIKSFKYFAARMCLITMRKALD